MTDYRKDRDELQAALRAMVIQINQGKIFERDACVSQARKALAGSLAMDALALENETV